MATRMRVAALTLSGWSLFAVPALAGFSDQTEAAGVSYRQHLFDEVRPIPREEVFMSGGASAGDFDGDGWVDLFVTRLGQTDLLFRNLGDGSFEDVSAEAGFTHSLETNATLNADFDNDGDLDLYLTTIRSTRAYLYINDGRGVFSEQAVERGAAIDTGNAHTLFGAAAGDYDHDGWLDIQTGEWFSNSEVNHSRLLRNLGDAMFTDKTEDAEATLPRVWAFSPRFADMDNDGWLDLPIAADFGTSRMHWNDGDGTFTKDTEDAGLGTDENGMGSAIGDIDNDGDLDWFVSSIFDPDETCEETGCNWGYSGNRLYRNDGERLFVDITDEKNVRDGGWGWGSAFFDYDNDGDLDLALANGQHFPRGPVDDAFNHNPMRLWRNDGTGAMSEVALALGLTDARDAKGLLTFDYDRDGDLDIFVTHNGETPVLYRNDDDSGNHWLQVQVRGQQSNRDGFGVRVYAQATEDGPTQMRELSSGTHFLGQSENIAHFGFGSHEGPLLQLRIVWPTSGREQIAHAVALNQRLFVDENDEFPDPPDDPTKPPTNPPDDPTQPPTNPPDDPTKPPTNPPDNPADPPTSNESSNCCVSTASSSSPWWAFAVLALVSFRRRASNR